jgi:peptide/nickel transport system substrate-binding protein
MRKNKHFVYALSVFLVIPFSLSAQSPFRQPYTEYELVCGESGGKLILSTASDPKSFNPIVAQETSTTQIVSYLFEGLTRTDPLTMEVLPNLAKKWETDDGKIWTFYLRDDVRWNDGENFTADDVLFTFNDLIYNPDIPAPSRAIFLIEDKRIILEKVDDYTIRFKLPSVFAPFLRALSHGILPHHKYASLVKEKRFTFSMGLDTPLNDIVGTGPFRLKSYLSGERKF